MAAPLAATLGALFGAIIGSFIATLVLRAGEGRGVGGRSACDGCGKLLGPLELLPLISWLMQRGRCRQCGSRIDPLHPIAEWLAAICAGLALWLVPGPGGVVLALFALLLLTLALFDARHFWLPHWLSALTALTGLALGGLAMAGLGLAVPFIDRLAGAATGFLVLSAIAFAYRTVRQRQGLGGGDAPMVAAIGAWLGWTALPLLLLFAALAGLSLTLARLLLGHRPVEGWQTMRLPFGALLAVATPITLWLLVRLGI